MIVNFMKNLKIVNRGLVIETIKKFAGQTEDNHEKEHYEKPTEVRTGYLPNKYNSRVLCSPVEPHIKLSCCYSNFMDSYERHVGVVYGP